MNEQCIGTSVVDCPLAGMGDVIFLAFLLVLEIQNKFAGVSRNGKIYLLEDFDLVSIEVRFQMGTVCLSWL